MVMGENSCPKGRGFESRHCMLDGHFFIFLLKRKSMNEGFLNGPN